MKHLIFAAALVIAAPAVITAATPSTISTHPEAKLYDATRDARADVSAPITRITRLFAVFARVKAAETSARASRVAS